MKLYYLLFGLAAFAIAIPFILAAKGRDNYADDEGMSVEHWKKVWTWLTRR